MSRIVAIDYGRKRTGIAVSDTMQIIANGLTTVPTHELLDFITNYVKQESVERIIIGLPKQMNNELSENMKNIEPFVRSLKKRLPDMPVEYVDERFTSVLAHRTMLEAGLKKKDRQNKALVERATRYITAAGSLLQDSMRVALSCTDTAKARAFAGTLSRRYISSSGEAPHEEIRLLSALTLQGIIFYSNTIAKLADTTVVLDDEYGAASRTAGGGAAKRTQHRNLLLFHEPIRKNRASVHSRTASLLCHQQLISSDTVFRPTHHPLHTLLQQGRLEAAPQAPALQ